MFDDTPLPFGNEATPPPQNNEDSGKNWKQKPQASTPPADPQTGEVLPPKQTAPANTKQVINKETPPSQNKQEDDKKKILATPAAIISRQLFSQNQSTIENFLGGKEQALMFMSAVRHALDTNPKLTNCTLPSLFGAFMECAALGLYPSNYAGDCYILPYEDRKNNRVLAQFQLGYQGVKTLAYRAGVLRVWSEVVYENDEFDERLGSDPYLHHKKPKFGEPRGKAIGAYACAEVRPGKVVHKSMDEAEIMKIKALSKAGDSVYSPWSGKTDPMKWMWAKTCIKQLKRAMPTNEKLDRAMYLDNVSERGGYIQDETTIVEAPFEESQEDKIEEGKARKEALRKKKK